MIHSAPARLAARSRHKVVSTVSAYFNHWQAEAVSDITEETIHTEKP